MYEVTCYGDTHGPFDTLIDAVEFQAELSWYEYTESEIWNDGEHISEEEWEEYHDN